MNEISKYLQAKVDVSIDWSRFIIKTAANNEERKWPCNCGAMFFCKNYLGRADSNLVDQDNFDDICDHLVIIEKAVGSLCWHLPFYFLGL